jgi:methylase of polypeptide subunit release factors
MSNAIISSDSRSNASSVIVERTQSQLATNRISARSNRDAALTDLLSKVGATLPDTSDLSSAAESTVANLIDMAISISRLHFQQRRESLAIGILKDVIALDSNELTAYFVAWQACGNSVLKNFDTESSSQQTKEFVRHLQGGYYRKVLDDLSSHPVTSNGKPRLIGVLSSDLGDMDLFTRLDDTIYFLGRIDNPELAVSLSQARKNYLPSAYALLEHLVKLGKEIRSFYYNNIKFQIFSEYIFGPAIDTFFFLKVLHEFIDRRGGFPGSDRLLELGAGSGAILYTLTQRLASDARQERIHAIATDISNHAIAQIERLFSDLVESGKARLTTIMDVDSLRRAQERYGSGSVDILLVSPPYIPRVMIERLITEGKALTSTNVDDALDDYILSVRPCPRAPTSSEDIARRATEDLDLYVQALFTVGPKLLASQKGIMFLLTSSTSEEIVRQLLKRSSLSAVRLDHRASVPLEVPELTSGALRAMLLNLPGVSVDLTDGRYPLRHALTVYALFHPQSVWATELRAFDDAG